MIKNLIS